MAIEMETNIDLENIDIQRIVSTAPKLNAAKSNYLEIHDLSKTYKYFKLDHVSFVLPKGKIMGFIGENGAGKSTTINLCLNQIKKESGTVKLLGQEMNDSNIKLCDQLGVIFDTFNYHDCLNAKMISQILSKVYKSWNKKIFFDYVEKFKLPTTQIVKEFSKGMKAKLSIAAVLAHNPKLIIMDEPTSGLDPIVRDEILNVLKESVRNKERSILFSSHITSDLEKIADDITFIHQGKIVFSLPTQTILSSFGILHLKKNELPKLEKGNILAYMTVEGITEVLVTDRDSVLQIYPKAKISFPTLDEIMLLYVKGEKL